MSYDRALVLSGGASHGAFQAGAIAALEKAGWEADLVIGNSVGAINGAAYAQGMDPDRLIRTWENVTNEDVYRFRPWKDWLRFWKWSYLFDTSPLREFLDDLLDMPTLSESDRTFLCSGIDVRDGQITIYSNDTSKAIDPLRRNYRTESLTLDSIMASAALPGIFPWVDHKWDGSLRHHAPLKPAVKLGVSEVIILHIDYSSDSKPIGLLNTLYKIADISSHYQLSYDLDLLKRRNKLPQYRDIDVTVISPSEHLGYSKLDFGSPHMASAIREGYFEASEVMEERDGSE
jgi:predicted acylesterase/phospholipase RssA